MVHGYTNGTNHKWGRVKGGVRRISHWNARSPSPRTSSLLASAYELFFMICLLSSVHSSDFLLWTLLWPPMSPPVAPVGVPWTLQSRMKGLSKCHHPDSSHNCEVSNGWLDWIKCVRPFLIKWMGVQPSPSSSPVMLASPSYLPKVECSPHNLAINQKVHSAVNNGKTCSNVLVLCWITAFEKQMHL